MRERINRLARGIIDSESPQVTVEPKQVEESVPVSPKAQGGSCWSPAAIIFILKDLPIPAIQGSRS